MNRDLLNSFRFMVFCFCSMQTRNNKPGTTEVGAISTAQNCKRDPLCFVNFQLVAKDTKNEGGDFEKKITVPKNVKGGTLWDF